MKKKKKVVYTDEPMGRIRIIKDFLPRPEDLVFKKEETVKITLSLPKECVVFFKEQAAECDTQYQKMIRALIVLYVQKKRALDVARKVQKSIKKKKRSKISIAIHDVAQ